MFWSTSEFALPDRGFQQERSAGENQQLPNLSFEKFLLAAAAHDLRQPLLTMKHSFERLGLGTRSIEDVNLLQRGEDALHRIAEDLSLLGKALFRPHEKSGLAIHPVDLGNLLAQVGRDCEEQSIAKGVYVRVARTSAEVESNPILLRTLLRNLALIAVASTEADGQVLIGARRRDNDVRVDVIYTLPSISHPDSGPLSRGAGFGSAQETGSDIAPLIVRHALGLLGYRSESRAISKRTTRFSLFAPAAPAQEPLRQLDFAEANLP